MLQRTTRTGHHVITNQESCVRVCSEKNSSVVYLLKYCTTQLSPSALSTRLVSVCAYHMHWRRFSALATQFLLTAPLPSLDGPVAAPQMETALVWGRVCADPVPATGME